MEQLYFQMKEIRDRHREIIRRRRQKLEELGAFDEEGHVIQEVLDDEARELGAEGGRLSRQLFDLKSEERAQRQIHDELMVCNFEIHFCD